MHDSSYLYTRAFLLVGKQGERGEAEISSRQTRLNAVDERWKIDRSVKKGEGVNPQPTVSHFHLLI